MSAAKKELSPKQSIFVLCILGPALIALSLYLLTLDNISSPAAMRPTTATITNVISCERVAHTSHSNGKSKKSYSTECKVDYTYHFDDQDYNYNDTVPFAASQGETFKIVVDKTAPANHALMRNLIGELIIFCFGILLLVCAGYITRTQIKKAQGETWRD